MGIIREIMRFSGKKERELLNECIWEYPSEKELKNIPIDPEERYTGDQMGDVMDTFAISLFKKRYSEIGYPCTKIEKYFKKQNAQFFETTQRIRDDRYEKMCGRYYIDICKNILLPKIHDNVV